jgi:hypothetical protein
MLGLLDSLSDASASGSGVRSASARRHRRRIGLLFDLSDQHVAHHDLRHPARELHDVVSNPVRGLRVEHQSLVSGVENADGNDRARPAVEQLLSFA